MAGIPGQFFREFGLTVSIAVIFSLIVARFVTPLMAAHLLGKTSHAPSTPRLADRYRGLLDLTLRRPLIAVGICLAVLTTTAFVVPLLPLGFQPAGNPDYIYVKIQGPPGATAADMDALVHESTTLFAVQPETLHVFAQVGSKIISTSGGDRNAADLRDATMTIVLNPGRQTSVSSFKQRLRPALRSIPDGDIHFLNDAGGADVVTVLTGDDAGRLETTAAELLKEIDTVRQIADPRYASPPRSPEIRIEPRVDAAGRLGVSTDTIAAISRMGTIGDSDANAAKINDGDRRIPVQLRYQNDVKQDLASLSALPIPTATGGQTTLGSVADINFGAGPAKINHFDRRRQITIEADLQEGAELGDATRAIRDLPVMKSLPEGIRQSTVGNQRAMDQLFGSFALVFAAALTAVYCVLVLLFRSFIRPIVIVCALPPALSGAFMFLYATGCSLNLPSLIGILMVLGLSAKNSILLVDYAGEREREGYRPGDAIVEACMMRARPILMTTLAMIGGMIPAALALGKGAEFRQPMAMAVIGGLLTTTLVSLLFVPAAHLLISRIGTRRPFGLAHGHSEGPDRTGDSAVNRK
jgi:HAE1 family hydrophobic/amphiphilic exporter-1